MTPPSRSPSDERVPTTQLAEYRDGVMHALTQDFRRVRFQRVTVVTADPDNVVCEVQTLDGNVVSARWLASLPDVGDAYWAARAEDGEYLLDNLIP